MLGSVPALADTHTGAQKSLLYRLINTLLLCFPPPACFFRFCFLHKYQRGKSAQLSTLYVKGNHKNHHQLTNKILTTSCYNSPKENIPVGQSSVSELRGTAFYGNLKLLWHFMKEGSLHVSVQDYNSEHFKNQNMCYYKMRKWKSLSGLLPSKGKQFLQGNNTKT